MVVVIEETQSRQKNGRILAKMVQLSFCKKGLKSRVLPSITWEYSWGGSIGRAVLLERIYGNKTWVLVKQLHALQNITILHALPARNCSFEHASA